MPYRFASLETISTEDGAVFAKANFRFRVTFSSEATPLPGRIASKSPTDWSTPMGLFSSDIKSFEDLFLHTLQDIYYAENQITKALPTMIQKASDPQLRQGFETHLRETENQLRRLDQVFSMLGQSPKAVDCPAIDGIIEEAKEVAGEISDCMFALANFPHRESAKVSP
jgi:hypothetical protein